MSVGISKKLCSICGAPNAGMYYNGLSCIACKSFFVRAATSVYPHVCFLHGDCTILPNKLKNCKGCRYRKCLQAGMEPSFVYLARKSNGVVPPIANAYQLIQNYVAPTLSLGFHFVAQATYYIGPRQLAKYFMNIDKITLTQLIEKPQFSYFNLNVSLADVFLDSSLCYQKEEITPSSPEELFLNIIPHSYCKFLVSFVDFASAVPELSLLSGADTMKVVQNKRVATVSLRSFYCHHVDSARLERQSHNIQLLEIISPGHAEQMKKLLSFFEEQAEPLFTKLNLTEEEMTILRLISVVSPFPGCSEEGNDILRRARGKYINILVGYHQEVFPQLPADQRVERLRLLLSFLKNLQEYCGEINQRATLLVLNNVCNALGPLSYDVQVRDYKD